MTIHIIEGWKLFKKKEILEDDLKTLRMEDFTSIGLYLIMLKSNVFVIWNFWRKLKICVCRRWCSLTHSALTTPARAKKIKLRSYSRLKMLMLSSKYSFLKSLTASNIIRYSPTDLKTDLKKLKVFFQHQILRLSS